MTDASELAGSGPVAPDGSPVEFYRELRDCGEAAIVHAAVPPAARILELGCGAGRITHALVELGHPVVAVDNSPEMLAHVSGAETVLSEIESLDLVRKFPAVLLASYLVNTVDRGQRRAFLDTCARHVADEGAVVLQRAHPEEEWARRDVHESSTGGARVRTRILERRGSVFHAVAEYAIGGRMWKQDYWSELLDDETIAAALAQSGLAVRRWLDERRQWVEAVPAAKR